MPEEASISVPGEYNPFAHLYSTLESVPQAELDDKPFLAPAGNVVGGGTVVNGLLWFRSSSEEYSAWQQLGATNVSWNALLPYFKKNENFSAPSKAFAREANISYTASVHGTNGPIDVSYLDWYYPSSGQ